MRILLSAYACEPGKGSEPEVGWNWAVELARQGHWVTVLTRGNNRTTIEPAHAHLQLSNLSFVYYDLPRWASWWKKGSRGVQLYYLLWQWGLLRYVRRKQVAHGADLVHHITFGAFRPATRLGALRLPLVVGPIGGGETTPSAFIGTFPWKGRVIEYMRRLGNRLFLLDPALHRMLAQSTVVLCRTPQTMAALPMRYRAKCVVQPEDAVSPSWIASDPSANRSRELLYAGRLLYWKGIHLAITALARARRDEPALRMAIVGRGPDARWLQRTAASLGIEDAITWHDWLPQDALRQKYRQALALVFPSLHDSGGTVAREALAAGTPVLCLKTGGPAEIVPPDAGFVIDCDKGVELTIQAMAQAMLRLIREPELVQQLGANAICHSRHRGWATAVDRAYQHLAAPLSQPPESSHAWTS